MNNQQKINKAIGGNLNDYIPDCTIEKVFASKYQTQAIDFLISTDTTMRIEKVGCTFPLWSEKKKGCKPVNHLSVTLKNSRGEYTFDFWCSIYDTYGAKGEGLTPDDLRKRIPDAYKFYDVLACLTVDVTEGSFDEFCASYGYEFKTEKEYIRVKAIHIAVQEQDKALRKLFTEDALQALSEIN